jgi:hypothetical protein
VSELGRSRPTAAGRDRQRSANSGHIAIANPSANDWVLKLDANQVGVGVGQIK